MKQKSLIYLFMLILFVSCNKKEYPKNEIESEDVTFFSNLNVNGNAFKLEAGKNGYYMYSSYQQDSNGLYSFVGELKVTQPSLGSLPALKIQFNDSKFSTTNGASNIDNSLISGKYNFYDASYSSINGVEFESSYNKNPKAYLWDFGDGTTTTEANPIHYFKNNGTYSTCLTIEGTSTCKSSICTPVSVGSNAYNGYINSQNISDTSFLFSALNIGGKAPFTYWWTFGDGGTSQVATPKHAYAINGSYPVNLRVSDADSKTLDLSYNVVTLSDNSSCASNIRIKTILPSVPNLGLSQVIISYTDEFGQVYTSSAAEQNSNNVINVVSIEDFENNEKGEKTKKIKLNFKCELVSGGKKIQFESSESIFCISFN